MDARQRGRLAYVPGDVAVTPYPPWAQSDRALGSIAGLMRRSTWPRGIRALARDVEHGDGRPGRRPDRPIVCHNDVCPENVVFRDGEAVGLLDFDFAAPGPPIRLRGSPGCAGRSMTTRAARVGWDPVDLPSGCGWSPTPTASTRRTRRTVGVLDAVDREGRQFVLGGWRPATRTSSPMWKAMGGMARLTGGGHGSTSGDEQFVNALR